MTARHAEAPPARASNSTLASTPRSLLECEHHDPPRTLGRPAIASDGHRRRHGGLRYSSASACPQPTPRPSPSVDSASIRPATSSPQAARPTSSSACSSTRGGASRSKHEAHPFEDVFVELAAQSWLCLL